jgi:hypothetical protein
MTCSMRVTKLKVPTKTKNLHNIGRISSRYHGKKRKIPNGHFKMPDLREITFNMFPSRIYIHGQCFKIKVERGQD